MIKEMIGELNRAMYENEITFGCVRTILEQLSKLTGKEYTLLNRRVVIKNADGTCNDAYVNC